MSMKTCHPQFRAMALGAVKVSRAVMVGTNELAPLLSTENLAAQLVHAMVVIFLRSVPQPIMELAVKLVDAIVKKE